MKNTKLLVIVDESHATRRALEYVAQVASRRRDFRICLAHALPNWLNSEARRRPASVHISADGFPWSR
jgi:microsomal dipeptidase-like Zn-dependent dipeptidase